MMEISDENLLYVRRFYDYLNKLEILLNKWEDEKFTVFIFNVGFKLNFLHCILYNLTG